MIVGVLPNVNSTKSESGCKFGDECSFAHKQVDGQPSKKKKTKKYSDKIALFFFLKKARQVGRILQDTGSRESLGPTRRVQFTKATQRHANIRENKGLALGKIQVKVPHQRRPYALNFDGKSHNETQRQERCVRGNAWRLAPMSSVIKLEEREFVVHGTSMQTLNWKDLNSPELGTARVSKKSDDGCCSQRRRANKRRGDSAC